MGNRTVIYTANTGGKDRFRIPDFLPANIDYILFTDSDGITSDHPQIQIRKLPKPKDPTVAARMLKLLPHIFLPQYDTSVWIDASVHIKNMDGLNELIDKYMQVNPFAVFPHMHRTKLTEEVAACLHYRKGNRYILQRQLASYLAAGYDDSVPMVETGVLIRQHHHPQVVEFSNEWWQNLQNYSPRDQVSFVYSAWRTKLPTVYLPGFVYENDYFSVEGHKAQHRFARHSQELWQYMKWAYAKFPKLHS